MRNPFGFRSASPSLKASGRPINPYIATEPAITRNMIGTSCSAPANPSSSSRNANTAVTAAATTPRGAIADTNRRSGPFNRPSSVHKLTANGRTKRTRIARNNANLRLINAARALHSTPAAKTTNSAEMMRIWRFSLNSVMCVISTRS